MAHAQRPDYAYEPDERRQRQARIPLRYLSNGRAISEEEATRIPSTLRLKASHPLPQLRMDHPQRKRRKAGPPNARRIRRRQKPDSPTSEAYNDQMDNDRYAKHVANPLRGN